MKQKMGRKLLGVLLALVLVLGLVPGMSLTALAVEHNHEGWTAWNNTNSLPTTAGSYYLTADVTISGSWSVPSGTTNLCLNRHSITRPGGEGNQVISVGNGATLNLYDESGDNGTITHSSGVKGAGVWVGGTGIFNMYGGKITGNTNQYSGGGVSMSGGTFTMHGGSITDNSAQSGGGVYVGGGIFTMSGGIITQNNTTNSGGGVYVEGGTFTMSGGSITNNTAADQIQIADVRGGGVCVYAGATFAMSGGSITGNTAGPGYTANGGGVYVCGGYSSGTVLPGTLHISGSATINGNTKTEDSSSAASNVVLGTEPYAQTHDPATDAKITIAGEMTGSAPIGVTMEVPGTFTSGWGTYMGEKTASNYFTSDDSDYELKADSSELKIGIAHEHSFTYSVGTGNDANTITATCGADGCSLTDKKATLTLVKPTLTTYGETGKSAEATLTGLDAFKTATGLTIAATDIKYAGRDGTSYDESTTPPTNAGSYTASITLDNATASVTYSIARKAVTVSDITASNKTYDGTNEATLVTTGASFAGKLGNDNLTVSATGAFENANVGEGKNVTISGLTLDGTSKENYVLAEEGQQTTATANITAKEIGLEWSNTELTYNGEAQKPTATATGLVDGDTCTVTVTGEQTNAGENYTATAESLSNSNYKLPENATTTFKIVKANAVPATVTANNRTFDVTEKPLVTVDNSTLVGGEMRYALSENATTAPAENLYTTSIPTGTNAGT